MIPFGESIRDLRDTFELSQLEVSRALGFHQATLSKIESGKQYLDPKAQADLWCLVHNLGVQKAQRLATAALLTGAAAWMAVEGAAA